MIVLSHIMVAVVALALGWLWGEACGYQGRGDELHESERENGRRIMRRVAITAVCVLAAAVIGTTIGGRL